MFALTTVQSCMSDDLYHTHTFDCFGSHNSSLEGSMKLKFAPFCSSWDPLSVDQHSSPGGSQQS